MYRQPVEATVQVSIGFKLRNMLVAARFSIRGSARFLSHTEMVRVFQRACARAGIRLRYSQGFNPHPKLSLPLPRSVGLETEDDLLVVQVEDSRGREPGESEDTAERLDAEQFRAKLCKQLPEGCELLAAEAMEERTSLQARAATYRLSLQPPLAGEGRASGRLSEKIERLLAGESLYVERQVPGRAGRSVDVRNFIKSIEVKGDDIIVECGVSPAGSIRVEEILRLLELDTGELAAPVRRVRVCWELKVLG